MRQKRRVPCGRYGGCGGDGPSGDAGGGAPRDHGLPVSRQASIAELAATDAAMKVSTDAVQVLAGPGGALA